MIEDGSGSRLRGAFVPWLYSIASTIGQVSLGDMARNAAAMASAVTECARLLGPSVVSVNLDPTVWAEASGCEVSWVGELPTVVGIRDGQPDPDALAKAERVRVVVEALERTRGSMPHEILACAIAGPAMLAEFRQVVQPVSRSEQFLIGELAGEAARLVCEQGVDLLVVMEGPSLTEEHLAVWIDTGHYARILRIAHHYSVDTLLLSPAATVLTSADPGIESFDYLVSRPEEGSDVVADMNPPMGIMVQDFGSGACQVGLRTETLGDGSQFLTTPWDIDPGTDLSALRRDMVTISALVNV